MRSKSWGPHRNSGKISPWEAKYHIFPSPSHLCLTFLGGIIGFYMWEKIREFLDDDKKQYREGAGLPKKPERQLWADMLSKINMSILIAVVQMRPVKPLNHKDYLWDVSRPSKSLYVLSPSVIKLNIGSTWWGKEGPGTGKRLLAGLELADRLVPPPRGGVGSALTKSLFETTEHITLKNTNPTKHPRLRQCHCWCHASAIGSLRMCGSLL